MLKSRKSGCSKGRLLPLITNIAFLRTSLCLEKLQITSSWLNCRGWVRSHIFNFLWTKGSSLWLLEAYNMSSHEKLYGKVLSAVLFITKKTIMTKKKKKVQ